VCCLYVFIVFFFSSRRRHTRSKRDWSSDVCSSDLEEAFRVGEEGAVPGVAGPTVRCMPVHIKHQHVEGQVVGREIGHELLEVLRSEERRVGKEGRAGVGAGRERKKKIDVMQQSVSM